MNAIDDEMATLEELENQMDAELESQLQDLDDLKKDFDKIGNPDSLGQVVKDVVWDQFVIQVGAIAGEDFIKENRELKLDLSDDAHIQTVENFAEGKIATHNAASATQLQENYDRYKNMPHSEFRDKYVDPTMGWPSAKDLNEVGIDTVTDIYTGRQIPTQTKLENGQNNPLAIQREHVKPSAKLYADPSLQMANSNEELAAIINDPENLRGYTTAERNLRKSDNLPNEMDAKDKTKHWEKANEKAEKFIEQKKKEGEQRLKNEGKASQMAEAKKIGKAGLRSFVMILLADLIKKIVQKLVSWFRSAKSGIGSLIDSLKEAIHDFITNLKKTVLDGGVSVVSTILTAIFGPIVSVLKKTWTLLKQGYRSMKEAFSYLKDPKNKGKSFSIKMMEVGKIVITGLAAVGALVLGEVIEKGLIAIGLNVPIPLLGSLASILGMFFGAVVSGIIGAIVLRWIDKKIAKKQKQENISQQIDKGNEILETQEKRIKVSETLLDGTKVQTAESINQSIRDINNTNETAANLMRESVGRMEESFKRTSEMHSEISVVNDIIADEQKEIAKALAQNNPDLDDIMNNI